MLLVKNKKLIIMNETEKEIEFDTSSKIPKIANKTIRKILTESMVLKIEKEKIIITERFFGSKLQQPRKIFNGQKDELMGHIYSQIFKIYNESEILKKLKRRF